MAVDTVSAISAAAPRPCSIDFSVSVRRVLFQVLCDSGVEVPTKIVEPRRGGQSADLSGGLFLQVQEAHDDVGNLNAGIINVVLHLDAAAGVPQQAHESVPQRGVAQVAEVGGLVGVDVGVLDDVFRPGGGRRDGFAAGLGNGSAKKRRSVEISVQVAAASDL